ncbi:putative competence-damaged protein CinA [Candidatus Nanopelagicus limnes]|uniref:Putative competence-damaged protein CinA n=1 Tax=Candidatus Nanopelagicus limnae TaxID=1884634 RepID=A0A249JYF0_9ACTN|nr:CinA family protein [Candidatus Nanopelagicus limnes]ASY09551.1 putative competence-damaged protein CinA [Candidatus Nanopelagicus limnes]
MSSPVLAKSIVKKLTKKGLSLSVAESVTAGGLASELTKIAGSSKVFKGGVIAYSDEVKISELKISKADLKKHTAVSEEIAIAMAQAVRLKLKTDYAISTTGVAGPGKAYGQKVGTAWVGVSSKKESFAVALTLSGDRESIRHAIIASALAAIERILKP